MTLTAADVMTEDPTVTTPNVTLGQATRQMEDRDSQISALPVVDPGDGSCLGLIRIHDIYQSEVT